MANVIVRAATPEDAPLLHAMNVSFNGEGCTTVEAIRRSIMHGEELVFYAEKEGTAVGFICGQVYRSFCYGAPCGELTELYVQEGHRREGIARLLIAALERCMCKEGVSSVRVLTGDGNAHARALYERCGYALEDERVYQRDLRSCADGWKDT